MSRIRLIGLAFAAVCAFSGVSVASAVAAPEWLLAGKPITTAMKVKSKGTLELEDTKGGLGGGAVRVSCTGTDEGTVGPGAADVVEKVTVTSCSFVSGETCESPSAVAVDTPWKTEVFEEGGKARDHLKEDGKGKPGWEVTCHVFGVPGTDKCTGETSVGLENVAAGVNANFDETSRKSPAECSRGGKGTGLVFGTDTLESTTSEKLEVSP